MALVLADRVRETTTTTGTGSVTLGGAYTGFQTFSAGIGNANNTYYTIANSVSGEWEVGIGTYTTSGNTLSRDTVLASSNAGSLVVFTSGTKDVFVTQPAERAVYVNAANTQVSVPQLAATSLTVSGTSTLTGVATLTANPVLSAGTANGVTYLNGSKSLTSGTSLVFDGTNLGIGTSSPLAKLDVGLTGAQTVPAARFYSNFGTIQNLAGFTIYNNVSGGFVDTTLVYGNATTSYLAFGQHNGTSYSEKMRLDASGNLGIGTSSPAVKLDVNGITGWGGSTTGIVSSLTGANASHGNGGNLRVLTSTTQAADVGGSMIFGGYYIGTSNSIDLVEIAGRKENSTSGNTAGYLQFGTRANAGNITEKMRIDSSGNVGIGLTPTTYKFEVTGGDVRTNTSSFLYANTLRLRGSDTYQIYENAASTNLQIGTASGAMIFAPSTTERMRIDTSGNLLVGTTSTTLENSRSFAWVGASGGVFRVNHSTANGSGDGYMEFGYNGTKIGSITQSGTVAVSYNTSSTSGIVGVDASTVAINTASSERMRIDSSGNVGIGTTSPSSKLYTQLSSATAYSSGVTGNGLTIYNSSATTNQYVGITLQGEPTTGNGGVATIMGTTTGSGNMDLTFSTRGSATLAERMRIDSTGLILIRGGTAPTISAYDAPYIFRIAGGGLGLGGSYETGGTSPIVLYTQGTERMRIDSSGNVGIGTASIPSNKDTVTPKLIVNGAGVAGSMQVVRNTTPGNGGAILELTSTRGSDVNSYTILQSGDGVGTIEFGGADGNEFVVAGSVVCQVDGTPGDNDMPGRLIFNTTADGASSTTERMRIDSAGNAYIETGLLWQYAPTPTTKAAAATLTAAELATDIITLTGTTYTITLPTGTALDTYYTGVPAVNIGYDFHIVNTASGIITIAVGASGMTSVGLLTVAATVSAHFRLRRTAANTYILYRLS